MECIGCGSSNALETLQEGFCYTCRSDDRLRELEAENAKLREALQEIADSTHLGNSWARHKAKEALLGGKE